MQKVLWSVESVLLLIMILWLWRITWMCCKRGGKRSGRKQSGRDSCGRGRRRIARTAGWRRQNAGQKG